MNVMEAPVFQHEEVVDKSRSGERLDAYLLDFPWPEFDEKLSPSRSAIQRWISEGRARIDGEVVTDKSRKVREGQRVRLEVEVGKEHEIPPPEALDIEIVYRDQHFLVIDKPPGITSHPVKGAMTGSVVNFLYHEQIPLPVTSSPMRPGIVHRLDKNSSGLMLIASSDVSKGRLIEMIKAREVVREYLALVWGNPGLDEGTIDAPIGRYEGDRTVMAVMQEPNAKPARTHFRVLTRYPGFSLVACKLDTGRTHQIRVHMSHIGYPVAGDPLYGGRRAMGRVIKLLRGYRKKDPDYPLYEENLTEVARILTADSVHLLHAARLTLPHPVSREILTFTAQPHEKFLKVTGLLEKLPHEDTGHAF